tara:strand:- start:505 stop:1245 length:741 start_codon:yes stop_codon:yes gene_type:complete
MKIIIDNVPFEFDLACKVLKLKGGDSPFEELNSFWNEIVPIDFAEISLLPNLEQRRIAIKYLGIDDIVSQVNPQLISEETISKETTWINELGVEETIKFDDTYRLFSVNENVLLKGKNEEVNKWNKAKQYFVKFKDTSTDREYMIWVDIASVYNTNHNKQLNRWNTEKAFEEGDITAIDCIAWTIKTTLPTGNIETIIRQGDCVLLKPKSAKSFKALVDSGVEVNEKIKERHLTSKEYRELLKFES